MQRIPEITDVDVPDVEMLADTIVDDETGEIIEDRKAPDLNGDREAMNYQGIDPDSRGPFPP